MTAALALIPIILQYLPQITLGVENLVAWIASIRLAAKQTGEWTDAMEAQYRASLLQAGIEPEYQPDAVPAAAKPFVPVVAAPLPKK